MTPSAYGKEIILVVEDDDDVRAFVSETLRDLNFGSLEAQDANISHEIARSGKELIDLLLTDVILPGQNGQN